MRLLKINSIHYEYMYVYIDLSNYYVSVCYHLQSAILQISLQKRSKRCKVKPKWVYNQMGFRKGFFTGIIFCLQTGMKEIKQNSVGPRDPEMKTESENIRA